MLHYVQLVFATNYSGKKINNNFFEFMDKNQFLIINAQKIEFPDNIKTISDFLKQQLALLRQKSIQKQANKTFKWSQFNNLIKVFIMHENRKLFLDEDSFSQQKSNNNKNQIQLSSACNSKQFIKTIGYEVKQQKEKKAIQYFCQFYKRSKNQNQNQNQELIYEKVQLYQEYQKQKSDRIKQYKNIKYEQYKRLIQQIDPKSPKYKKANHQIQELLEAISKQLQSLGQKQQKSQSQLKGINIMLQRIKQVNKIIQRYENVKIDRMTRKNQSQVKWQQLKIGKMYVRFYKIYSIYFSLEQIQQKLKRVYNQLKQNIISEKLKIIRDDLNYFVKEVKQLINFVEILPFGIHSMFSYHKLTLSLQVHTLKKIWEKSKLIKQQMFEDLLNYYQLTLTFQDENLDNQIQIQILELRKNKFFWLENKLIKQFCLRWMLLPQFQEDDDLFKQEKKIQQKNARHETLSSLNMFDRFDELKIRQIKQNHKIVPNQTKKQEEKYNNSHNIGKMQEPTTNLDNIEKKSSQVIIQKQIIKQVQLLLNQQNVNLERQLINQNKDKICNYMKQNVRPEFLKYTHIIITGVKDEVLNKVKSSQTKIYNNEIKRLEKTLDDLAVPQYRRFNEVDSKDSYLVETFLMKNYKMSIIIISLQQIYFDFLQMKSKLNQNNKLDDQKLFSSLTITLNKIQIRITFLNKNSFKHRTQFNKDNFLQSTREKELRQIWMKSRLIHFQEVIHFLNKKSIGNKNNLENY